MLRNFPRLGMRLGTSPIFFVIPSFLAGMALFALSPVAQAAIVSLPSGDNGIASHYPNDVNIQSDPSVLFSDDFEAYSSASQLLTRWNNYYQTANTRVAGETGTAFAGLKSLEFTQPQGSSEVANEIVKNISPTQTKVFVRVYTKFSQGFSVTSPGHNGIRIQGGNYPGPGRIPTGSDFFVFSLENSAYYNEAQPGYTHIYTYHPEQRSQWGDHWYPNGKVLPLDYIPGNFGPDFVARPNVIPATNQWYCYELMVQENTPGQRDGRVAIWIDGNVVADFPNLRMRDIDSLKINQIMLGLHAVGNTDGVDRKWYDDLVVATSYIGPMLRGSAPTAPTAPTDPTPPKRRRHSW